jgi:hypothetical protein
MHIVNTQNYNRSSLGAPFLIQHANLLNWAHFSTLKGAAVDSSKMCTYLPNCTVSHPITVTVNLLGGTWMETDAKLPQHIP